MGRVGLPCCEGQGQGLTRACLASVLGLGASSLRQPVSDLDEGPARNWDWGWYLWRAQGKAVGAGPETWGGSSSEQW